MGSEMKNELSSDVLYVQFLAFSYNPVILLHSTIMFDKEKRKRCPRQSFQTGYLAKVR